MIKLPEMRVHDLRAEYIGCFKTRRSQGNTMADPTQRWHDPHYRIFEEDHSRYAEGPFYALRGRVISAILRAGLAPRLGGPEGNASTRMENYERSSSNWSASHMGIWRGQWAVLNLSNSSSLCIDWEVRAGRNNLGPLFCAPIHYWVYYVAWTPLQVEG